MILAKWVEPLYDDLLVMWRWWPFIIIIYESGVSCKKKMSKLQDRQKEEENIRPVQCVPSAQTKARLQHDGDP